MLKGNKMNFIKNFWQKRKKMILWATGIGFVFGVLFGFALIYFDVCDHPVEYQGDYKKTILLTNGKTKDLYKFELGYFLAQAIWFSLWGFLILSLILNIVFLIIVKIYEIIKNLIEGE
jgi:hypothetical protein